jgi:membrane protease YdiL (CAAX protease family)
LPSVRANLLKPSILKVLALAVAVAAGLCDEGIFRKLLMDWEARAGYGAALQILSSGLAFGVAHSLWGPSGAARATVIS